MVVVGISKLCRQRFPNVEENVALKTAPPIVDKQCKYLIKTCVLLNGANQRVSIIANNAVSTERKIRSAWTCEQRELQWCNEKILGPCLVSKFLD